MKHYSRRELLIESGRGFGALALAGMVEAASPNNSLAPKLAAFPGLREVDLKRTSVTDKGLAALRAAKPNILIYSGPWEATAANFRNN